MPNIDLARIASNIGALSTLMSLDQVNKQLATAQSRLSSGRRINSAADDPAGLTIATKLKARSEGLKVALDNIGDAKSLLSVAEAGVGRINDVLVEMRNKTMQGANETLGLAERAAVLTQLRAYIEQVDDTVNQTEWNGNKLINGQYDQGMLQFQTGASAADITYVNGLKDLSASGGLKIGFKAAADEAGVANDPSTPNLLVDTYPTSPTIIPAIAPKEPIQTGIYSVRFTAPNTVDLLDSGGALIETKTIAGTSVSFDSGIMLDFNAPLPAAGVVSAQVGVTRQGDYNLKTNGDTGSYIATADQFRQYMATVEGKMNTVSSQMGLLGAYSARLGFKEEQIMSAEINIEASYSRIMNANMAEEQVNASKFAILQQTATAMLAQINKAPEFLMSLFK
jgi:flagellin